MNVTDYLNLRFVVYLLLLFLPYKNENENW